MAPSTRISAKGEQLQTTFLIPNLHCSSCTAYLEELFSDLTPSPTIKAISFAEHSLIILHDQQLSAALIASTLQEAGFDVFDVILDRRSQETLSRAHKTEERLHTAVQRWSPHHPHIDDVAWEKHGQRCDMCTAQRAMSKPSQPEAVSVVALDNEMPSYMAVLSIEGMTCSSCVNAVTKELHQDSSVISADVNLLNHSATISFRSTDPDSEVERLISSIEDIGYGAELAELKAQPTAQKSRSQEPNGSSKSNSPSRTVSIAVDGMYCPDCPNRIHEVLQGLGVQIIKPITLRDPTTTISYTPEGPIFTIRTIIDAVSHVHSGFSVSVHRPPSVEERSRRMLSRERKGILARALLAIITAIPTLIIGIVYMNLVSHSTPGYWYLMQPLHGVSRAEWATFIMATIVYFFAADHFHRRTVKDVYVLWRPRSKVKLLSRFYRFGSMNMLITLGTTVAYFSSLAQLIVAATRANKQMAMEASRATYFDSVVFLTMFLLIGRYAEAHMKMESGNAVAALGNLRPSEALLVDQKESMDDIRPVSVDLIDSGDVVRVLHGSSPPCDGVLLDDAASMDESSLTGEAKLVQKKAGDVIYSGTLNRGAAFSMQVTGPAGMSMLDSIIQVVREGQAKRAPVERVADLLTAYFVPVIVLIAILTWVIWLSLGVSSTLPAGYMDNSFGGWSFWSLQFAIAVFVIACPCGLGLAAPTALFVGSGIAAKNGILVHGGGEAFQEASSLDCIVFDKTGTLTEGTDPAIVESVMFPDTTELSNEERIQGLLKAVEEQSTHPLAKAAVNFGVSKSWEQVQVSSIEEIPGRGLKGYFSGRAEQDDQRYEVLAGSEKLMQEHGIDIPPNISALLESWAVKGYSLIVLAHRENVPDNQWHLTGAFAVMDHLRTDAAAIVTSLQAQGIDVWMISGDSQRAATAVARQVGILDTNVIAGVLPAQKAEKVKYLQMSQQASRRHGFLRRLSKQRGRATVAFVGDGINDAPALAAADVGIALASGSDVAVQSAAFILIHSDLRAVLTLVALSRAVFSRVILNFFWAAIYNVMAVPIAAGVLYPVTTGTGGHVRLSPSWAALAMALSSISVVGSSLLLRTKIPGLGFRNKRVVS